MRSFAVIGMGRFGQSTAIALSEMGHEVVAIDNDEDKINAVRDQVLHAIVADATDERVLERLGIRNFDVIIVSMSDEFEASILTTVLCKELGAKVVVANAHDDLHAKLLRKTGADRVVQPELDGGIRLAHSLHSERVIDTLDLSDNHSISEMKIPKAWVGKSLVDLNVRAKFKISVIAIRRGGHVVVTVDPTQPLSLEDTLFVIGTNRDVERVESL